MTLEEQALKLYPPLSCYEKEPIEYNRRQTACREAWLRAKREDAAEIGRMRTERGDCQIIMDSQQGEIDRLRAALNDIQAKAVSFHPPRCTWFYDRAEEALDQQLTPQKE